MWLERDIRGIAAGQHGVITRTQLTSYGVTDHEIARRIREGRMEQRYDGVYYLDAVLQHGSPRSVPPISPAGQTPSCPIGAQRSYGVSMASEAS